MKNTYTLEDIYMPNGVVFRDSQLVHGENREESMPGFWGEHHRLVDEMTNDSADPPGCHSMFRNIDGKAFYAQKGMPGAIESFRKFRAMMKDVREQSNLVKTEARTLLAWRDNEPIGGIVIYHPIIVGLAEDGAFEYGAHIGPFMTSHKDSYEAMGFMLENDGIATHVDDPNGVPNILVRLVEWQFPILNKANRWDMSKPTAQIFADYLNEYQCDFSTEDGMVYRTAIRAKGNEKTYERIQS